MGLRALLGNPRVPRASQFPITTGHRGHERERPSSTDAARAPRPRGHTSSSTVSRSSSARTASSAGRLPWMSESAARSTSGCHAIRQGLQSCLYPRPPLRRSTLAHPSVPCTERLRRSTSVAGIRPASPPSNPPPRALPRTQPLPTPRTCANNTDFQQSQHHWRTQLSCPSRCGALAGMAAWCLR